MELRDKILDIILKYPQYKLVGGYSIIKNMKNSDWEARATTDLDIRICSNIQKENNIDFLINILNDNNLKTEIKITKNNNYKIFVYDGKYKIKVDIEYKDGSNIESNIKNLKESLKDKFELVMLMPNKQFKNVVDVIICLHDEFPDGISKKEFLNIVNKDILYHIDLSIQIELSQKFKPNILNGLKIEEYAIRFNSLLEGLLDDTIDENSIFKDGKWYY